jgi:FtsP/CotA-like multicopper oxidase with cupredoxin domain
METCIAMGIDRRWFLAYGGGTALGLFTLDLKGIRQALGAPIKGGTLEVGAVPKFVTPLSIPPAMPQSAPGAYRIAVRQREQQVLPPGFGATTVWSYGSSTDERSFGWPACTIEARRGTPLEVTWINELKQPDGRYLPHLLPVDPTLHWANPPGPRDARPQFARTPGPYAGPVPVVTHAHGMVAVDDWSDGYPEAWFLPDAVDIPADHARVGTWYEFFRDRSGRGDWAPGQATFRYPNTQPPCMLWYHDHTLGLTRLNIYAGLAGFYLIRSDDPADHPTVADSGAPAVLPAGPYEIPLAIQDRSFNADGSLFYPDARRFFDDYAGPYIPESAVPPIWVPEFFGNCMVVNGRTWPYHSVEPRRYRLRILNGCNSRFLILRFSDPKVEMWQIGSDGGYLRAPARLRRLLLAPAERVDLIVDFSRVDFGARVTLQNLGPDAPFKSEAEARPSDRRTTGLVMQFRVDRRRAAPDTTTPPGRLQMPPPAAPPTAGRERPLALVEAMTAAGQGQEFPHELALGTFDPAAGRETGAKELEWADPVTENPAPGDAEVWAFYNLTGDAHPMHVHDVMFELVERQKLDPKTGRARGQKRRPRPEERGPKDTITAYPDEVTRVRMTFARPGQFVWHCHVAEHEDNEMMRPYRIGPEPPGQPQGHGPSRKHRP